VVTTNWNKVDDSGYPLYDCDDLYDNEDYYNGYDIEDYTKTTYTSATAPEPVAYTKTDVSSHKWSSVDDPGGASWESTDDTTPNIWS